MLLLGAKMAVRALMVAERESLYRDGRTRTVFAADSNLLLTTVIQ